MERDYKNIYFIINKTPEELLGWWESLSDDDREYAMEILTNYRKMLDEPIVEEYTVAREYLKKFQLNK
jgi:hypothetical protein